MKCPKCKGKMKRAIDKYRLTNIEWLWKCVDCGFSVFNKRKKRKFNERG